MSQMTGVKMDIHAKYLADAVSAGAIIGTLIGFLPAVASVIAVVWYAIQIYESPTFQKFLKRFKSSPKD